MTLYIDPWDYPAVFVDAGARSFTAHNLGVYSYFSRKWSDLADAHSWPNGERPQAPQVSAAIVCPHQ